jgi:DNA-binding NarL/FixJ family response regulator
MGANNVEHVPTPQSKAEVSALVSFGNNQEQIAQYLKISVDTLARHYRSELDTALIAANAQVANKLFRKATEENDLTAMIFWLKTFLWL